MTKYLYPGLRHGLVGAWCPSLGATGHRLLDRSGYNNHGTLTNMDPGTDWVASDGKLALAFAAGSGNAVSIPDNNVFDGTVFSISAWVNQSALSPSYRGIIRHGTGPGVFVVSNGKVVYFQGANRVTSAATLVANKWYHIGFISTGTTISLYIDGKFDNTATYSASFSAAAAVFLGGDSATTFDGFLDDFFFHERVLMQNEIAILAQRRGIAYETVPGMAYKAAAGGPPPTFTGRNMLVGCAF